MVVSDATVVPSVFGKSVVGRRSPWSPLTPTVRNRAPDQRHAEPQIGEFSFILTGLGVSLGILPDEGRNLILPAHCCRSRSTR